MVGGVRVYVMVYAAGQARGAYRSVYRTVYAPPSPGRPYALISPLNFQFAFHKALPTAVSFTVHRSRRLLS